MDIPSAVCPKCGCCSCGWALLNPRHQMCSHCGTPLHITAEGRDFTGYSPLAAEKLTIQVPQATEPANDAEKPTV